VEESQVQSSSAAFKPGADFFGQRKELVFMKRPQPSNQAIRATSIAAPFSFLVAAALFAGCGGGGSSGPGTSPPTPPPPANPIQHVVVVVMENRTVDNLFHTLPGVDTVDFGLNSAGEKVTLEAMPLASSYDPDHSHAASFVTEYNAGSLNGFDKVSSYCGPQGMPPTPCPTYEPLYRYVQSADIQPYISLAHQFGFADHVLQTNQGPSYPAHEYLVGAQSGRPLAIAENPDFSFPSGGCNAPAGQGLVWLIDLNSQYPGIPYTHGRVAPCNDFETIFDRLGDAGKTWKYYTPSENILWNAPKMISHICGPVVGGSCTGPLYTANDIVPETTILTDIASGNLANVSYVVPNFQYSDHARVSNASAPTGPDFVGAIANTLGQSAYWRSSVMIVVWDDWGGWYDHYKPAVQWPPGLANDPYEYGFRVPLMVISPYVRQAGMIDHTQRDFTSILHFVESIYKLPPLGNGSLETLTDDLTGMFNFSTSAPLGYTKVPTSGFKASDLKRRPRLPRNVQIDG
jgi:phospholipase C